METQSQTKHAERHFWLLTKKTTKTKNGESQSIQTIPYVVCDSDFYETC